VCHNFPFSLLLNFQKAKLRQQRAKIKRALNGILHRLITSCEPFCNSSLALGKELSRAGNSAHNAMMQQKPNVPLNLD